MTQVVRLCVWVGPMQYALVYGSVVPDGDLHVMPVQQMLLFGTIAAWQSFALWRMSSDVVCTCF